jgi:hypothetical protein
MGAGQLGMKTEKETVKKFTPNKGDEIDRAGITVFRDVASLQPARQLIFCVRR